MGNLILKLCTPARALLSPTLLQSSWDGGCEAAHFIPLRFQKTALLACPQYCTALPPLHAWRSMVAPEILYFNSQESAETSRVNVKNTLSLSKEHSQMQARHEITPLLGKAKLSDIRLGPCQRLEYLALITSKSPYRSIPPASEKTVSPNTYQPCIKTASNSVHRSWQRAAPCPVRSDVYSITCTMGPRRAGWPLTARDGLINHGHLLDCCAGNVINGFVDWAMQQTLLHLLKQQSHSAKGTGFTQPANRRNCWEVPQTPIFSSGLQRDSQLCSGIQTPCHRVFSGGVRSRWRTALVPTSLFMWGCRGSNWHQPTPVLYSMQCPGLHPAHSQAPWRSPGATCASSICRGFLLRPCSRSCEAQLSLHHGEGSQGWTQGTASLFLLQRHCQGSHSHSPHVANEPKHHLSGARKTSLEMNNAAEQRWLTMNYAHCSPLAAFSPPPFSLYFCRMGTKQHEEGQTEALHRAPRPYGFTPALQAPSPNRAGLAQPGRRHDKKLSPSHQVQP